MKTGWCFASIVVMAMLATSLPFGVNAEERGAPSMEGEPGIPLDGRIALNAISAYLDEQIGGVSNVLQTVAATRNAQSGVWGSIKPLLEEVKRNGLPGVYWYARTDGSYFTTDKGLVSANIKDRPYFPKVMAGSVSVGELVVSRSTGENVTVVVVPIMGEGGVKGMLGASLYLDALNEKSLKALDLPDDVIFYVLDSRGITALHFWPEYIFQDPTALQNPSLARAVEEMLANPEGLVHYEFEGKPRDVMYRTSPLTGWHIALGLMRDR